MPLAIRNLCVLAYINGFTMWHYKSGKERLEAITGDNYFAEASDMLTPADMIVINAADGSRIVVVSRADNDKVTVAPLS